MHRLDLKPACGNILFFLCGRGVKLVASFSKIYSFDAYLYGMLIRLGIRILVY